MSDDFEPVIVMASIVPGHDGLAKVAIVVQYPNGAQRPMALSYETVGPALDVAGFASLDQLIGQPWTVLAMGLPSVGTHHSTVENTRRSTKRTKEHADGHRHP